MARYDRHGGRLPTSILEAAAWHLVVVASCRKCDHEAVFNAHALWWLFERKHWDPGFRSAGRRMKCTKCGAGADLGWARDRQPTIKLPLPDERAWKRAVSRFRS